MRRRASAESRRRFIERRGAADVVAQQANELLLEPVVLARCEVGVLELLHRRDQRLGHEASAEGAEVAACIWIPLAE